MIMNRSGFLKLLAFGVFVSSSDSKELNSSSDTLCVLMTSIFDEQKTVVYHFMDNSGYLTFDMRQCVENYPGRPNAYYCFQENGGADPKDIVYEEELTGVILMPSSSKQVTIDMMNYVSLNYYSWTTVFCYFFNVTDLPPLMWISKCCDVLILTNGYVDLNQDYVIFEHRTTAQQVLVFSTGRTNVACGKCGLVTYFSDLLTAQVRPSMQNKTLVCATRNKPWFFTLQLFDMKRPRVGFATGGFEYLMMEDIRKHLGFSYYVRETIGINSWGRVNNGSWEGILSQLVYREAHFALGDLSILHPRNLYFAYTFPHDFDVLTFVSKIENKPLSSSYLITIMDAGSWYSILILGSASCIFLVVACKLHGIRVPSWIIFLEGAEFIYACLTQPSVEFRFVVNRRMASVLLLWSVGVFVLSSVLSGALVTFITSPGFEGIIDSFTDWAKYLRGRPDSRVCMTLANYQNFFDPTSNTTLSEDALAITDYVYHDCLSWPSPRIVREIVMGTHGFWLGEGVELTAEFIKAAREGSSLAMAHVATHYLNVMHQGIVLQRACAYTAMLGKATKRLFETGHIIHYKKMLRMYTLPPIVVERDIKPLSLGNISGLLTSIMVIQTGMLIPLLGEMILKLWQLHRKGTYFRGKKLNYDILRRYKAKQNAFDNVNMARRWSEYDQNVSLKIHSLQKDVALSNYFLSVTPRYRSEDQYTNIMRRFT